MSFDAFKAPVKENPKGSGEAQASELAQEPQGTSVITPSGMEIYYQWAPRRLYRILKPHESESEFVEVPSVTTVLGVLDKSGPLTWWGQGVGVEGTLELLRRKQIRHYQGAYMVGGEFGSDGLLGASEATKDNVLGLLTEQKLTVNHVKDSAADRGVNVHGALETWVESGCGVVPFVDQRPEAERGYVTGLRDFLIAVAHGTSAEAELMVGSLEHQYAGRFDLVLTLTEPLRVATRVYPKKPPKIEEIPAGRYLLDLKTSKRVYNTHFLQLEAYEHAAVECGYEPTDHRGVVHVTADGRYELVLNKDWTFEDFKAVRACYQVINEREVLRVLREDLDATDV